MESPEGKEEIVQNWLDKKIPAQEIPEEFQDLYNDYHHLMERMKRRRIPSCPSTLLNSLKVRERDMRRRQKIWAAAALVLLALSVKFFYPEEQEKPAPAPTMEWLSQTDFYEPVYFMHTAVAEQIEGFAQVLHSPLWQQESRSQEPLEVVKEHFYEALSTMQYFMETDRRSNASDRPRSG